MKILQINTVIGYGSTGKITTDLYDFLEEKGHDCLIAFGIGEPPLGYKTFKISTSFDFFYHRVYSRLTDRHAFASKRTTKKFIQEIKRYKPDVIHLHNVHGFYLNIELLFDYLSESNIPVVWLLHDQWAVSGHSANFDLNSDGTLPTKLTSRSELKNYPTTIGLSQFKRNLKDKQRIFTKISNLFITTPSEWLANMIKKSFLNKYPIQTIHNGTDTEVFKIVDTNVDNLRGKWHAEDKVVVLGVASVWDKRKGLEDFAQLAKRLPTDKYQIVLVGIDSKTKNQLPSEIFSIERTNSVSELVDIYNASDLFVNLTYFDNFPTVNIEALACGTPVITYDTGGSGESVNEYTGRVVQRGNLSEVITEIEKWDKKSEKIKTKCRDRALNLFSKNIAYAEYLELYSKLVVKKSLKE